MALGYYNSVKASTVQPKDVDVYYTYTPSRQTTPTTAIQAIRLESTSILTPINDDTNNLICGSYNLRLASDIFNQIGIYNIFVVPKKSRATIVDCGVLLSDSSKRGIVLDTSEANLQNISEYLINDGLNGYTLEYYDTNGVLVPNLFRVVTSCNLCEPVADNTANSVSKQIKYRFNDAGSLLFLTVTPSSTPSVKPTSKPYIGNAGDTIKITNSYFEPIMIELDMVEYGIEEIGNGMFGSQTKSVTDGILTIYDKDNNIYKQSNIFEILDEFDNPLFEVRQKRNTIDLSKDFNTIINPNQ